MRRISRYIRRFGADQYHKDIRKRSLRLESLEQRQMLSISPAGGIFCMNYSLQSELSGNALNGAYQDEGKLLTVVMDIAPEHGELYLDASGDFTYRPQNGYIGVDEFTCIVSTADQSESQTATVVLQVLPDIGVEPSDSTTVSDDAVENLNIFVDNINQDESVDGGDIMALCTPSVEPTQMFSPYQAAEWITHPGYAEMTTSWSIPIQAFSEIADNQSDGAGLVDVTRNLVSQRNDSGEWVYTERISCVWSFQTTEHAWSGEYVVCAEAFSTETMESFYVSTLLTSTETSLTPGNNAEDVLTVINEQKSTIVTYCRSKDSEDATGRRIETSSRRVRNSIGTNTDPNDAMPTPEDALTISTLFTVTRLNYLKDTALNEKIQTQLDDEHTMSNEWICTGIQQTSGSDLTRSTMTILDAERPLTLQDYVTLETLQSSCVADAGSESSEQVPTTQTVATHRFNIDSVFQNGQWDSVETDVYTNESVLENTYTTSEGSNETITQSDTQSETHIRSLVAGVLTAGSIQFSGNSTQIRESSHSGVYTTNEQSTVNGVLKTRVGTGNWKEQTYYSYQDSYDYIQIFVNNTWTLSEGTASTHVVEKSKFQDTASGSYTNTTLNGPGNEDDVVISGHWDKSLDESDSSDRTVTSIVNSCVWIDSGVETFAESGNAYTNETVDEATYTRTISGGSVTGFIGSYEGKSHQYYFNGERTLVANAGVQSWNLTNGTGWDAKSESSGNSYDGDGSYTITGGSGTGSSQESWNIGGEVTECGRIGNGEGVYTEWSPSNGAWQAINVQAVFYNTEQIDYQDISDGMYTDGTMCGTIGVRDTDYIYRWDAYISNDENQNILTGKAIETANFQLTNASCATGCFSSSYTGCSGYMTGQISSNRDDSDTSQFYQQTYIEFSLVEEASGASCCCGGGSSPPTYSWQYDSGTLVEHFSREVRTRQYTTEPQPLSSGCGNPDITSYTKAYDETDSWAYKTDERWEIVPTGSSLQQNSSANRTDLWSITNGVRTEEYGSQRSSTDISSGTGCCTYDYQTVRGTFDTSCTNSFDRTVSTTMTYTPESGKWLTTYGGIGHESFGREYTFSGEFDPNAGCYPSSYSGCITCEDTESYHTDRVLTYAKPSEEQNASTRTILNGPTSNPNSGCYGGFSAPGTWNSYGWTITGTGKGEISQSSWTVHNNPKNWTGTQFGTSMTGSESNKSENYWIYTILFTEEKSVSGNWKYTDTDCGGSGYFWSEKCIESTDNVYSHSVKQGLATLNGNKDYTESLTESNWYDIGCTVNASGQIVFNLSGYGSQTQTIDYSYSGCTGETTFTNGTVSLNESGVVHSSQERLVDWTYDASGFDADVTTTKETNGNHSFTYDYNYSSSCNGYANTFNQDWSENSSWSNERTFLHTFSNATWNVLWADRFTSYEQTGCGCGSGSRSTNSWSSGCGCSCGCGCTNSKEDAYGYEGSWSESYDSATLEYLLTGGIDNQVSGSMSYSGCGNSYHSETHSTGFYGGAYTTDSEFSYINPSTTGALYGILYTNSGCGCGGGSGCNGLYGYETSIPAGQVSDTSCTSTKGRVPGMSPFHSWSSVYSSNMYTGSFYNLSSMLPPSAIRMETRSGNYRDPTAISSNAAQNSIFNEWKLWRDESRMNAELDEVITLLAGLQNPSTPSTRAAKLHEPGLVVLDLYNVDGDTDGQNVSINVSSYIPASSNYQLRVAEDETLVDAALTSGILTISVPQGSTQDGMTAVTVVGQDANGFLVSWTVTVHVAAVTGYDVEEQSWGETSWGETPEDSGVNSATDENWSVLWRENDYRWQAKTTADGLISCVNWYSEPVGGTGVSQEFAYAVSGSSRDRWAYGTPVGNGEQLISPTVTFGGASIYHPNAINTVSVGMRRETELNANEIEQIVYTADQRRIAVTYVESFEWEPVAYSREVEVSEYHTSVGVAKLAEDVTDGYLAYPDYQHHEEIQQPMEHSTVRIRAELGSAIPEGMKGTLHLDWYDPNNVLANISTATNNGHGTRDNDEDDVLNAAENGLPGWTLAFTATDSGNESDSVQKSYLSIAGARYADNFIVAAHPNADTVELYEFQGNILKYQDTTGLWSALPNSTSCDLITSTLTIMPSVDIDTDSDNSGTIERSDWEESIENEADYTGKYVRFNNNDDNENEVPDYQEYPGSQGWTAFSDPDLVQVILDRGFADLSGMGGWTFELKVTTGSDFGLKYWLDDEKSPIVNGTNNGLPVQIIENGKSKHVYQWTVSSEGTVDYPSSIYVEGVNAYGKTDTLMWRLLKPVTPVQPGDPTLVEKAVDTVKMTDPFLNLWIDSDNSGEVDFSDTEEFLEDAEYALGKQVTWGGYEKMVVEWLSSEKSGYIAFTTTFINSISIQYQINDNEYRAISMNTWLSVSELFNEVTRATFYIYGETKNNFVETFRNSEENTRTETFINLLFIPSLDEFLPSLDETDLIADRAKYFVAADNDFLSAVAKPSNVDLRAALAAKAIYDHEDLKRYGMELTVHDQVQDLDQGIYRDYNSYHREREYIYAVQGTDMNDLDHWRTNLRQAYGHDGTLYQEMINFFANNDHWTSYFPNWETLEGRKQYLITGHSLGGGLASALSLMTGINAVTFNAAGLHQYTIEEIGRIFVLRHKQMQEYNPQITAYQVDYDILSRLQGRTRIKFFSGDNIPNAYGTIYPLTSQYRSDNPLFVDNMVNVFGRFGQGLQNLFNLFQGLTPEKKRLVNVGITCHSMNQVIYGMLYLLNLQTNGHDAFGYPEEYGFRMF